MRYRFYGSYQTSDVYKKYLEDYKSPRGKLFQMRFLSLLVGGSYRIVILMLLN